MRLSVAFSFQFNVVSGRFRLALKGIVCPHNMLGLPEIHVESGKFRCMCMLSFETGCLCCCCSQLQVVHAVGTAVFSCIRCPQKNFKKYGKRDTMQLTTWIVKRIDAGQRLAAGG